MRLRIYSDLHLEFYDDPTSFVTTLPTHGFDVLALCGDITNGHFLTRDLEIMCTYFCDVPIMYVPGNHDYYHSSFATAHQELRRLTQRHNNFHWLRPGHTATVRGQRFVGATLWYPETNKTYASYLRSISGMGPGMVWNDFKYIGRSQVISRLAMQHAAWLARTVTPADVVLTHMLPSRSCISARFMSSAVNDFFVHDLTRLIEAQSPKLWCYGHTHDSSDSFLGTTRLVCNPCGYDPDGLNKGFDTHLTVQI